MMAVLEKPARLTWSPAEVLGDVSELRAPADREESARTTLWDDLTSEYDARFLSAYVGRLDVPLSGAFRETERVWAVDEANHYAGFRAVYEAVCDTADGRLASLPERRADFSLIEHLFEDEFQILVLCAYDELATVRAFRANMPLYRSIGSGVARLVRRVIADEAWHYSKFLRLLREDHGHRRGDAARAVRRVRDTEGTPYLNTFVLDHEGDSVWCDAFCDEAARVLLKQLRA